MAKLIDAEQLKQQQTVLWDPALGFCDCVLVEDIDKAPAVDATPVVRGFWKEFSRSELVNWKDGKPVWDDLSVYRCSECDFGTIIKHNYCPSCGAKMDLEASPDGATK